MEINSVCVFCGSRAGLDPAYDAAARDLGRGLAERGLRLVFGGGRIGLMGAVADAALAAGGEVVGVIPEFLMRREVGRKDLTDLIVTDSMHARKQRMFELSDAFIALPGGLGTLDETIEVATWKQLRMHDKPIIVLDVGGYWQGLSALLDQLVAAGFAYGDMQNLWQVLPTVEDALDALSAAPRPGRSVSAGRL